MKKIIYLVSISFLWACQTQEGQTSNLDYPETKKVDTVDVYFGTEVPDPYRWLEDDLSQETTNWVEQQNKVTFAYLNQIDFKDKIKSRLEELFDYERVSAPFEEGEYEYFYQNDGLQNQSVLYRKNKEGEEEIFLDPNKFSEDGTISLAGTSFTDDGSLFAYTISIGGSDWRKGIVIDAETKEMVEDTLHNIKFSGLSWSGNDGFYYSSYDKPKEGSELSAKTQIHKLFYHKLGTDQGEDKLVFGGESNPYRYVGAYVTEDNRYLVISAAESTSGNKLFIKDLKNDGAIIPVDEDIQTDEYVLHTEGDRILIQTNYQAPNQRVVETTIADPTTGTWKDVIPETENVLTTSTGGGYLFTNYLVDAKTEIKQYTTKGELVREVK
ncbi:MAG: S9 family peptidase, partial [Bacteroidota bacterium]